MTPSLRDHVPGVPDYPRLRAEIDAGHYPFMPEDEGELFARCEWLEAENVRLRAALEEIAEHSVVSEGEFPDDNCDWHCTVTMVARAKDALGG